MRPRQNSIDIPESTLFSVKNYFWKISYFQTFFTDSPEIWTEKTGLKNKKKISRIINFYLCFLFSLLLLNARKIEFILFILYRASNTSYFIFDKQILYNVWSEYSMCLKIVLSGQKFLTVFFPVFGRQSKTIQFLHIQVLN